MKNVLALFAFVLFAGAVMAQSGPKLELETTTVDYGVIEKGSDPIRVFPFTNVGTEPLIIKNAKGSCGCTVPDSPKEPIMPGESAEVKVKYDTNRVGKFTKTVTLTTNESEDGATTVLTIKGEVKPAKVEQSLPEKVKSSMGN